MWKSETIAHAWSLWGPVIVGGVLSIPLGFVVAMWLAARRRRAGVDVGWANRSAYVDVFMVFGTVPWLWLTLTPNSGHIRGYNLVPFRDLAQQVHVGHLYAAMQIGGNLLVFAALGFGMPIRWRVGPLAALVAGVAGSTIIETLQWVLNLGRYSSVDDVIVNATGALLAAVCSWPWWRRRISTVASHARVAPDIEGSGGDRPPPGADAIDASMIVTAPRAGENDG